jgi:hypothetical protein
MPEIMCWNQWQQQLLLQLWLEDKLSQEIMGLSLVMVKINLSIPTSLPVPLSLMLQHLKVLHQMWVQILPTL